MELSDEELRVLCCLVEKAHTTPDHYPLTTNALVTACNQKTSRDPVVDYGTNQVDQIMQQLRTDGWARTIRTSGGRTNKHKHVLDEKLGLSDTQQALIAVLGLRGPQSPGELKTRTERYVDFESFSHVVDELEALARREVPLVRNIGTRPGQSQPRWIQLLGADEGHDSGPGHSPYDSTSRPTDGSLPPASVAGASTSPSSPANAAQSAPLPTAAAAPSNGLTPDSDVPRRAIRSDGFAGRDSLRSEVEELKARLAAAEARLDQLERLSR